MSGINLGDVFGVALQAMQNNRAVVNDLDGENGNHGDNMVQNLDLIANALHARSDAPPADALRYAGQQLQQQGKGGTSQFYAKGFEQAAEQFQGKSAIQPNEVGGLLEAILGAVPSNKQNTQSPSQAQPQPAQKTDAGDMFGDILGSLFGGGKSQQQPDSGDLLGGILGSIMGGGQSNQYQQQQQQQQPDSGDLLGGILGSIMGGGQSNQYQQQQQQQPNSGDLIGGILGGLQGSGNSGSIIGDILGGVQGGGQQQDAGWIQKLIPAGMAYMQAKGSGASESQAIQQALMKALMSGAFSPKQAGSSRSAAGGIIAQSILKSVLGGQ